MKVSVITINYNDCQGLKQTIESVIAQDRTLYEFIIIDGGSSDGSKELLESYSGKIDYWVSEGDNGIYNAMNKGIRVANGEYSIFMNSGDSFSHPDVLADVFATGADSDIICGNTIIMEQTPRVKRAPETVTMEYLFSTALCHQSAFIRTDLLRRHPYDEVLRIVSDRKFFLQAIVLDNCTYRAVDVDVALYDVTGFSARNRFQSEQEWQKVLSEMIPERVLLDYGKRQCGELYGTGAYERMFIEIGRRKYRRPVYSLVRGVMSFLALFIKSAAFVKSFPKDC